MNAPQINADERGYIHSELTEAIIGVFYGLLLNFGPRPYVRRLVFGDERKKISVDQR